ncbi:alpha/beta hydrolase [Mesorhizobium sp. AR07]|uniref:alpha/beta hydrolase n=1 Tax=Mesorhizobium sp. AR07 TaxID=2865838 RepID=UPI002160C866|nr:alpha/beta hydrolase [Mesorhizobium sp. AR07]UVK45722.1 alpha/beta hydrolase [Mesorhizobium sp. AR07]
MPLYRQFETQEQLDWEYRPELRIDDPKAFENIIAGRIAEAEAARKTLNRTPDVHYGPTRMEKLDIYPASKAGAPIVIFIHGGYWFDGRLKKENYIWVAKGFTGNDVTTVIIDYDVCPKVTVDEIVRQCRAAIAWAYKNASTFGADGNRIYVTGNSAGGHLTAMMAVTDWVNDYGLPADVIKGGCPISGLYDIEPFQYTWIQPKIQFNGQQVRRNSPILHVPHNGIPLLVSWGSNESTEFWRQSEEFCAAWQAKGNKVQAHPQEGCDHFTAISAFADKESSFLKQIMKHMHECWV